MNKYKEGLRSNIWKYYIFEFLWSAVFFFPIFQLYYIARGMTITQIAFIGIAFNVSRMFIEIPSGVLADKWGRKKTLFLSQLLFIIDMAILTFAHSFWLYIVAAIVSGAWIACYSGTAVAFFYDTLVELKREKEYEKLWGRFSLIGSAVTFTTSLVAGYLFNISITLPYILTGISAFLSLFVILSFTEPRFHKSAEEDTILLHFKKSMLTVIKNENISFIVFFGAIFGFALNYLFNYGQVYLVSIGIPITFFGLIFAVRSIVEGLGATYANKIKNLFSYRTILTSTLLFATIIIFGLSYINNYIGAFVFIISFFIVGMFRILQRGYIHKRISSHNRATVDSVSSFSIAIFAIIFEPIAGKIADMYSIQTSFFILGCILLAYSLYYLLFKLPKDQLFY